MQGIQGQLIHTSSCHPTRKSQKETHPPFRCHLALTNQQEVVHIKILQIRIYKEIHPHLWGEIHTKLLP